jgi:AAA domain-containing protein
VAVVLDTLNKSFVGSESKDTDMANYIRAAEVIRSEFDCVVVIVHHCGHDETRPRGHSSLTGAVDAQIAITRQDMTVTAEVEYMRDGPEGTIAIGRAKVVPVGLDVNGRDLTSLVIEPADDGDAPHPVAKKKWPKSLRVFHSALTDALLSAGIDHQIPNGPKVKAVNLEAVRASFYEQYVVAGGEDAEQQQNSKRTQFRRCVERAQAEHLIGATSKAGTQIIWITTLFGC